MDWSNMQNTCIFKIAGGFVALRLWDLSFSFFYGFWDDFPPRWHYPLDVFHLSEQFIFSMNEEPIRDSDFKRSLNELFLFLGERKIVRGKLELLFIRFPSDAGRCHRGEAIVKTVLDAWWELQIDNNGFQSKIHRGRYHPIGRQLKPPRLWNIRVTT